VSGWWKKLGYKKVAGINGSFFPWTTTANPLGLSYLYEGALKSDASLNDEFMEVVYDGNKLHLGNFNWALLKQKYPKAKWAISLGNLLVHNGVKDLTKSGMFVHSNQLNPRTMLGQSADGMIILAVTDGRGGDDKGLTADQQADFMLSLGAVEAINCDGGGSSTLELDGKIINDLDGSQRPIANGLLVYCKGDYDIIKESEEPTGFPVVIGKVKLSNNLELGEVACRHCNKVMMVDYRLVTVFQAVRDHFGVAMRVVGYRCPEHNKAIGGDSNSGHMYGKALDISSWNGDISPKQIYDYIKANFDEKMVEGLGFYPKSHVHIDVHHNGKRVEWLTE